MCQLQRGFSNLAKLVLCVCVFASFCVSCFNQKDIPYSWAPLRGQGALISDTGEVPVMSRLMLRQYHLHASWLLLTPLLQTLKVQRSDPIAIKDFPLPLPLVSCTCLRPESRSLRCRPELTFGSNQSQKNTMNRPKTKHAKNSEASSPIVRNTLQHVEAALGKIVLLSTRSTFQGCQLNTDLGTNFILMPSPAKKMHSTKT